MIMNVLKMHQWYHHHGNHPLKICQP
uniref:Uncharacterized protein n=1 Tax=Anguilla anguilla TaxID=7936 RepID=A0A0E9TPU3_ANGAN